MALQTQTHTGSTVSDAPTATPPPPPHPGSAHDNTSPFSAAGSPPLILAFLAIGLFSATMIVVFGWRRIQFGRFAIGGPPPSMNFPGGEGLGRARKTYVLPEKPKLWEVWNADEVTWMQVSGRTSQEKEGYDGQWMNMMPLSANEVLTDASGDEIKDTRAAEPSNIPIPPPSPPDQLPSLRQALIGLRPLHFRAQQLPSTHSTNPINPSQSEPEAEKDTSSEQSPRTSATPLKTLRVGVAILLPSAQYPIYLRERTNHNGYPDEKAQRRRRKEPPDYSIGLYDCNWDY